MFGKKQCRNCEALKENIRLLENQVRYFRKLTDRLLESSGIAPVKEKKEEPEKPTVEDEIESRGGEVFDDGS